MAKMVRETLNGNKYAYNKRKYVADTDDILTHKNYFDNATST